MIQRGTGSGKDRPILGWIVLAVLIASLTFVAIQSCRKPPVPSPTTTSVPTPSQTATVNTGTATPVTFLTPTTTPPPESTTPSTQGEVESKPFPTPELPELPKTGVYGLLNSP